jgi:hypothetical protein
MNTLFEEDKIQSLLAVSGLIFPRTTEEIEIFNQLYKNYIFQNHPSLVDPEMILRMTAPYEKRVIRKLSKSPLQLEINEGLQMAARGSTNIPKDIFDKMKENQAKHDNLQ